MRRALTLAEKGRGKTSPNPLVGAVVVKDGRIIGEGHHPKAGLPHAEVYALEAAGAGARGATLFVTLEPCSFFGKTPPCADRVIAAGVSKVVMGLRDPNPKVSGKGIRMLADAGILVEAGLLAAEVAHQNEIYLQYITTARPFVLLKTALSLDGKITSKAGERFHLTGEAGRRQVHRLRSEYDAIMVGIGTVLIDNPQLHAGLETRMNPTRVVVDSQARLPEGCYLVRSAEETPTVLATTRAAPAAKIARLVSLGVEVIEVADTGGRVSLPALLEELGRRQTTSVLVEGGPGLAASLVNEDLIDKFAFLISAQLIGGQDVPGVLAERLPGPKHLKVDATYSWGNDVVIEAYPDAGAKRPQPDRHTSMTREF